MPAFKVAQLCAECGSNKVFIDNPIEWDFTTQSWVAAYCLDEPLGEPLGQRQCADCGSNEIYAVALIPIP
jgi:hypothetical protein